MHMRKEQFIKELNAQGKALVITTYYGWRYDDECTYYAKCQGLTLAEGCQSHEEAAEKAEKQLVDILCGLPAKLIIDRDVRRESRESKAKD